MKEVVIDQSPELSAAEKRVTDLHSILNIINVLSGELSLVQSFADGDEALAVSKLEDEVARFAKELPKTEDLDAILTQMRESESKIIGAVQAMFDSASDPAVQTELSESLSNLKSVYRIVHKRVDEIEARAENPDIWINMRTRDFNRQFREVFYAIEKNAKGRYRIFFNLARKTEGDYYIDLKIETELLDDELQIPVRLIDVLRDLTANARKYTPPGGKVALAIYQNTSEIQVLVEDSGCGIPADEIERVTEFGYRASNVRGRPTMGGGFGLPKAAWLINKWGGVMKIASKEGEGTTVRLRIPNRADNDVAEFASNFSI